MKRSRTPNDSSAILRPHVALILSILLIHSSLCSFQNNLAYIKMRTHEFFNFDEKINPIVKNLIEMENDDTPQERISAITGENYVKINEQHQVLENLVKDVTRGELEIFKEGVVHKLRKIKGMFGDFAELLSLSLNFADTIAVNKDKYIKFDGVAEENFSAVTTEFFRLWDQHKHILNYVDEQYVKYLRGVHNIVQMKCPGYKVYPVENFPNEGNFGVGRVIDGEI